MANSMTYLNKIQYLHCSISSISSPRSSSSISLLSSTTGRFTSDLSRDAYRDIYFFRNLVYLKTCCHDNFPLPQQLHSQKMQNQKQKLSKLESCSGKSQKCPTPINLYVLASIKEKSRNKAKKPRYEPSLIEIRGIWGRLIIL